jgi:hypothetical protein
MDKLIEFFSNFWQGIYDLSTSVINTFFDMLTDFWLYVLDNLITAAIGFLDVAGQALTFNPATYISGLPPETINIIGLIGLSECVTIITTAIGIRFLLQLIPFVRWGS